jgi:hypothetical protein
MASSIDLARQYTSFSGVDIKVVIAGKVAGQMQAVSYAVQREKAPIYVMGRVDPLSFSRGKRGIAGTMISLLLDQHLIFNPEFQGNNTYLADNDEISVTDLDPNQNTLKNNNGDLNAPEALQYPGSFSDLFSVRTASYVDQLPPFDTAIVAMNEYGKGATMRIYGCEILNEGSGFSIDDIVIENQMTYVCRTILPWQKLGEWDLNTLGNGGWSSASAAANK